MVDDSSEICIVKEILKIPKEFPINAVLYIRVDCKSPMIYTV